MLTSVSQSVESTVLKATPISSASTNLFESSLVTLKGTVPVRTVSNVPTVDIGTVNVNNKVRYGTENKDDRYTPALQIIALRLKSAGFQQGSSSPELDNSQIDHESHV